MPDDGPTRSPPSTLAWWHTRLTDDDNLHAALRRVADAGCHLLSNCQAASVTIIELGRPLTVASTGDAALGRRRRPVRRRRRPVPHRRPSTAHRAHRRRDRRRPLAGLPPTPPSLRASDRRCRCRSTSAPPARWPQPVRRPARRLHRPTTRTWRRGSPPKRRSSSPTPRPTGRPSTPPGTSPPPSRAAPSSSRPRASSSPATAISDDDAFNELRRRSQSREPQAAGHRHRDRRRRPPRRSTMNDIEALDAARLQLGLSFHDLWIRYIGARRPPRRRSRCAATSRGDRAAQRPSTTTTS